MTKPFTLKAYRVFVPGYGNGIYYAASSGKAMAQAWRSDAFSGLNFRMFLERGARAVREKPSERFGEAITVGGEPAFYVTHNQQYIQFVRPSSDVVLNSHPFDVEPPEARRGTPYYRAPSQSGVHHQ